MLRAAAFWLLLGTATTAAAQVRDPNLEWLTIETRHFKVHYHAPLGVMAREVAAVAERAHDRLAPLLKHAPRERTHVVLTDNSDDANGLASVLPYNTMRLYATAPEDMSALDDYDNWLVTLVTHEYAHILHLDTIGGIPAVLNAVLGKTFSPNSVQPRWFIEGLAVLEESKFSAAGRGRSAVFEMFLRMDALEGRTLTLDQMSNSVDRWPWGTVPYLYGSAFLAYIEATYGEEALTAISHDYGEQLIPYALSRTAKRATGKAYPDLYADFLRSLRREADATRARVLRDGAVEGRALTVGSEYARTPRFLDDQTVAYWVSDGRRLSEVRAVSLKDGATRRIVRANGPGSLGVDREAGAIVYAQSNVHRDLYHFSDLHRWDAARGEVTRLTDGLRAREPDVSPDGKRVAFVTGGAGSSHLAVASLAAPERPTLLVRSPRYGQVYTPRWSPDGTRIAFSAWRVGGYRDIRVVEVATGRVTDVTHDRALDMGPAWSPDGRTLYFSSDRTGIFNVYALDVASGALAQLTNVLGGAFQVDVSPDGRRLAFLGYSSRGYDVHVLDLQGVTSRPAPAYVDTRPPPTFIDRAEADAAVSQAYAPLETLGPRAYELELTTDSFGQALGILTGGFDAVGLHAWSARIGVGLERGNIDAEASYTYRALPSPITLSGLHTLAPRESLVVGGVRREWTRRLVGGEVSTQFVLPGLFDAHALSAGYGLYDTSKAEPFGGALDPNDVPPSVPVLGRLARLRAGWSYSNVAQTRYDVTPSWGHGLGVSTSMSHPYLGSTSQSLSLSWAAEQFVENPFVEHHVLAMRYGGGSGYGGRPGEEPVFAVGGFGPSSILDGLIDGIVEGGVALRGYAPSSRYGTEYHLLQTEYRFPLWRPQWGPGTVPVYAKRLWASAFVDVGDAFYGPLDLRTFRWGAGAELLLDFAFAYDQAFTLRLGAAQGLSDGGVFQLYANLGRPF